MSKILTFIFMLSLAGTATATPRVVTSVPPVQGLVADIMRGAGTPTLLLDGTVSPHDFALRPSQARELAEADLVFGVGLGLDFWLLDNGYSRIVYLGNTDGLNLYTYRELKEFREIEELTYNNDDLDYSLEYEAEEEQFDATDPEVEAFIADLIGDADALDDDHDGDDHDDHNRAAGGVDPHIWLDPQNAIILVDAITEVLTSVDLVNEAIYRDNASQLKRDIMSAADKARFNFDRLSDMDLVTTHDSIQYLERAFDLHVIGALSSADGVAAGARSLSSIYQQIGTGACLLVDINEPHGVAGNPFGEVPTVEIDPLGSTLIAAPNYYPRLLETLAEAMSYCRQ